MKTYKIFHWFYFIIILFAVIACTDESILNPADPRDQFIGSWNVNETCIKDAYSVSIEKDTTNSSQVIIKNFWLIGFNEKPPYAIVTGNTLTIPSQTMCYSGSNSVKGSGLLSKNTITWSYSVNDGADLYTCSATYEKP